MKIITLIKVKIMKRIGFLLYFFYDKEHIQKFLQKQGIEVLYTPQQKK